MIINTPAGDIEIAIDKPLEGIAAVQLQEYFSGKRKVFEFDVQIKGTIFAQKVLQTVRKIPFGKTCSYGEIAIQAGFVNAARAVGSVMKNNCLPIIIPCHRVICANGNYGHYNGGDSIKQWLIEFEKRNNNE